MQKVLVRFHADYADEFDVYGARVATQEEWNQYLEKFTEDKFPREISFGTNEFFEFETRDEFLRTFTVVPISDDEAAVLTKLFPHIDEWFDWGTFVFPRIEED